MDETISIVVPVYNVEPYIEKCLQSIVSQSYTSLEIILVDDGSTDHSGRICEEFGDKDARIHVIHKKNGGLSSARNVGIEAATGKYIGFVDSDDYIAENMFQVLYSRMLENDADISICGRYYTYDDGRKYLRYRSDRKELLMDSGQAILEMNSFRTFDMAVWDKLYKRRLFEGVRFPEGKLSEDFYIMYQLFDLAGLICYTPEPLYFYRQRTGSISRGSHVNFDFAQAAYCQMVDVEKKYPSLRGCVRTAYASANMTVYNFHLKNHVKCSRTDRKRFQSVVRRYFDDIKENTEIPMIKKIQAWLFCRSLTLYRLFFLLGRKAGKI